MKDYFLLLLFGIVLFGLAFFLIHYTKNIEGFQSLSAPLIESDTFLNNTLNPVIVQFRGVSNLFKIKEKFKEFITDWHNFSGNVDRNRNTGEPAIIVTYIRYDGLAVEERVEKIDILVEGNWTDNFANGNRRDLPGLMFSRAVNGPRVENGAEVRVSTWAGGTIFKERFERYIQVIQSFKNFNIRKFLQRLSLWNTSYFANNINPDYYLPRNYYNINDGGFLTFYMDPRESMWGNNLRNPSIEYNTGIFRGRFTPPISISVAESEQLQLFVYGTFCNYHSNDFAQCLYWGSTLDFIEPTLFDMYLCIPYYDKNMNGSNIYYSHGLFYTEIRSKSAQEKYVYIPNSVTTSNNSALIDLIVPQTGSLRVPITLDNTVGYDGDNNINSINYTGYGGLAQVPERPNTNRIAPENYQERFVGQITPQILAKMPNMMRRLITSWSFNRINRTLDSIISSDGTGFKISQFRRNIDKAVYLIGLSYNNWFNAIDPDTRSSWSNYLTKYLYNGITIGAPNTLMQRQGTYAYNNHWRYAGVFSGDGHFSTSNYPNPEICALAYALFIKYTNPTDTIDGIAIDRTNYRWFNYIRSGTGAPNTPLPNNHVYYSISGSNNNLSWNRFTGYNNDERELSDQSLSAMVADFKANIKKVLPDYGIASNINILDQKMLDSVAQSFYEYSDGLFEISYIYDVYPIGSNMFDIRFDKKQRLGPLAYINLRNSYQPKIIEYNNLVSLYEQNTWQEKYSDVNDLLSNISTIKTRDLEPVFNPVYTLSNRNPNSIRSEISRAIQSNVTLKTELAVLTNSVTTVMNQSNSSNQPDTSAISNYFNNLMNSPGSDMIKINLVQSKIDSNDNLLNNLSNQLDGIETNVARVFFTMPTTSNIIINGVALGPNAALTYNPVYSAGLQADMGQSQGNVNYQPTIVYTKNVTPIINPYYISFIKQAAQLYIDSIYNSLSSFTSNTYKESNGYIRVDKVFGSTKLDDKTVGFTWQESQYDFYTNKPNVQRIVDVKLKFTYDNTEYQNPQIYIDNNVSNIYIGSNTIDTTATDYTLINNNSIRDYRNSITTLNSEITSLNNQFIEEIRNFMRTSFVYVRVFEQRYYVTTLSDLRDLREFKSPASSYPRLKQLYYMVANYNADYRNKRPFIIEFIKKDYAYKSLDTVYSEMYNSNYTLPNMLIFMTDQVKRLYTTLPADPRSNIPWPASIINFVSREPTDSSDILSDGRKLLRHTNSTGPLLPNDDGNLIHWDYSIRNPPDTTVVAESFIKNNNILIDDAIEQITYNVNMMNVKREQITGYSNLIREQEITISNIRLTTTSGKFKFINLLNDQGNSITWNDYILNKKDFQDTFDLPIPSNIITAEKNYESLTEAGKNLSSTIKSLVTIRNDADPTGGAYGNAYLVFLYADGNMSRIGRWLDPRDLSYFSSNIHYYVDMYYNSFRNQRSKVDYYTTLYNNDTRSGILTSNIPYSNIAVKLPHRIDEETLDDNDGACPANMTCGNTTIMNQLVDEYNLDSNNSDKILRVFKAFTPNGFRCDYSVEMADSNGRTKKGTIAFDVGQNIEDCSYFITSNNGFNKGYFIIDKVDYVNDTDNKDISGFNFVGNALLGYSNSVKNTFNPLITSASDSMSTIYNSLTASRLLTYNALGKMNTITNLRGCSEISYDMLKNLIINNQRFRNTIFNSYPHLDSHMSKIVRLGISDSNTFEIAYQKDNYTISNNSPVLVNSVTAGARYKITTTPSFCDYTAEYISETIPVPPRLYLDSNTKLDTINLNSNLPYVYDDINFQNPNNFQFINPLNPIILKKIDNYLRIREQPRAFHRYTHYRIHDFKTILYAYSNAPQALSTRSFIINISSRGRLVYYDFTIESVIEDYTYTLLGRYIPSNLDNNTVYSYFTPITPTIIIRDYSLPSCIIPDFMNSNLLNETGLTSVVAATSNTNNSCTYFIESEEDLPPNKISLRVTFSPDVIGVCSNYKAYSIEPNVLDYIPNPTDSNLVNLFKTEFNNRFNMEKNESLDKTSKLGTVNKSFVLNYDINNPDIYYLHYAASVYYLNKLNNIDYRYLPNDSNFKGSRFYRLRFYQKYSIRVPNPYPIKIIDFLDMTGLTISAGDGYATISDNNFEDLLRYRPGTIAYSNFDPNPYIGPSKETYLKNILYEKLVFTPLETSGRTTISVNNLSGNFNIKSFDIAQLQFYKNRVKINDRINPKEILITNTGSLVQRNTYLLNDNNLRSYSNLQVYNSFDNNLQSGFDNDFNYISGRQLLINLETPISIDGFSFVSGKKQQNCITQWSLDGYVDGIWLNLHTQSSNINLSNYPSRAYQLPIFSFDNTRYELDQLSIKPPLLSECITSDTNFYVSIIGSYPYRWSGLDRDIFGIPYYKVDNQNNTLTCLANVGYFSDIDVMFIGYEKWSFSFNEFDSCTNLTVTNTSKLFQNETDTSTYLPTNSNIIMPFINQHLVAGTLDGCTPPIEVNDDRIISFLFDKLVKERKNTSNVNKMDLGYATVYDENSIQQRTQITDEYVDYNTLRIQYVKKIFKFNKIVYVISIDIINPNDNRYFITKQFVRTVDIVLNSNCSNLTLSMSNDYRYRYNNDNQYGYRTYQDAGNTEEERLRVMKMSNYTYSNNLSSKIPDYYTYLSRCDAFDINNSNYIESAVSNTFNIISSNWINRNPRSNGNDIMTRIGFTKVDIFLSRLYYVIEVNIRPYNWVNRQGNIIKNYHRLYVESDTSYATSYMYEYGRGGDMSLFNVPDYSTKFYLEYSVNLDINFETCTLNNYSYEFNPTYLHTYNDTNRFHFKPRGTQPFNIFLSNLGYTSNSNISNSMSYTDNTSNILLPRMTVQEKFNTCYSNALNTEIISDILNSNNFVYNDFIPAFASANSPRSIQGNIIPQNIYFYKKQDGNINGTVSERPRYYYIVVLNADVRSSTGNYTDEFNVEIYADLFINLQNNASINIFQIENIACSNLFSYQFYFSRIISNENITEYTLSNNYTQYSQGGTYRLNQVALMNSCTSINLNSLLNNNTLLITNLFKDTSLSNIGIYNKALYTKKDSTNLALYAIAKSYQLGSSNIYITEWKYSINNIQSGCTFMNSRRLSKIISSSNLNTYALSNSFIPFNDNQMYSENDTKTILNQTVAITDAGNQFRSAIDFETWGTRLQTELNSYLPTTISYNTQQIFGSNVGNIVNRYFSRIYDYINSEDVYKSYIAFLDDKDDIYYLVHNIQVIDLPNNFANIANIRINSYWYPTDYDTFLSSETTPIFKEARMRKCNINASNSSILTRIDELISATSWNSIITTNGLPPAPTSLSVMPAYFKLYSDTANDEVGYKYLLALRVNTNVEYYSEVSLQINGNFANCFDFVVLQPMPIVSLLTYNNGLIYNNITISNYISSNNYTRLSTYNPIQQLPTSDGNQGGNQVSCEIQNVFDTNIRPFLNDFSVLPRFLPPPFYVANFQIYNILNSNYTFNTNQNVTFFNSSGIPVTQPLSNIIRNYTTLIDNEYNLVVYDSNVSMTHNLNNPITYEPIKYTGNYVSIDIYASQNSLFLTMYKKVTTSNLTNSYILRTVTNVNVISNGNLLSNYNSNIFTLVRLKYNNGVSNCFIGAAPFYDDPIEYIPLSVSNITNYAVSNGFNITPEYEFYLTNNSPIERFTNKVDTSEKYYKYVCLESKKEFKIEDFKLYGIGEGLIEINLIKNELNKIIYEIRIPQEITSYTFRTNSFSPNYDPIRWELKGSTGKDWKVISRKSLEKEQPRNYQLPLIYLDGRIKTLSQPVSKITDKPPPRIEEKSLDKETLVKYYKQKIDPSIKPEFKKYMRDNDTYYCLFDAYDLNRNMVGKDLIIGFIMRDGRVKKPVLYEDDEGNYVPFDMRKKTIKEFWDRTIMLPLLFSTSF